MEVPTAQVEKFSIGDWSSGTWSTNAYTVDGGIQYDAEKPFTPSGGNTLVKNTAYEWKEAFSTRTDKTITGQDYDDIDGMTNYTDNTGSFYLMYGQAVRNLLRPSRTSLPTVQQ